jgi:hypothetical protein
VTVSATRERWHRLGKAEQHRAVSGICDWLWRDSEPVRGRMRRQLGWYEGSTFADLDATAYLQRSALRTGVDGDEVHWNVPRALVQTVTAKIAGRQRPKPSLVCTDADWATKRRAKRLERFAEATLHQPQGTYRDAWELATKAFIDSCVFGVGALKVFPDLVGEAIGIERVFPWELLVDPIEAEKGNPLNLFHRYRFDKDRLIAEFPEHRDAIHNARDDEPTKRSSGLRIARACTVYEAWRLPLGKNDKGRHAICIDKKTLHSEEWTRDEFPFLIFRWAAHLLGFGATSLIEESVPSASELNFTLARMAEGERKLAAGFLTYEENTVDEEKLKGTKIGMMVPVKPGATHLPKVEMPSGYSESTLRWLQLNYDKTFELPGVSQMNATSRKDPGVTAGVAIRALANMDTERFATVFTGYEQGVAVDLVRHIIACAREVSEVSKDFRVSWPGAGYHKTIRWNEADLEDDMYVITGEAIAGIANTPADRRQLGQDLYNAGIIGPDAFLRIIQLGGDVDAELKGRSAQRDLIERYIESWLDATPEAEATGEFRFRGPLPWMKLPDAIVQVGDAYMQAELDEAPDWNLDHFARFLTIASDKVTAANAAQNAVAAGNVAPPAPSRGATRGLAAGAPVAPGGSQLKMVS